MNYARWKNNLYKGLTLWSIAILLQSFWYAQNNPETCNACVSTPSLLVDHMNFVHSTLQILESNWQDLAQGMRYGIYGPWQGGIYGGLLHEQNPSGLLQNLTLWTFKNIVKKQSSIRSTSEITALYLREMIVDWVLWTIASTKPRWIARDYDLLMDIDWSIADTMFELGNQWQHWKKLTTSQHKALNQLFSSYMVNNSKIIQDYTISTNTSATEILRILLNNNRKLKTAILQGGNIFKEDKTRNSSTKNASIVLSESYIRNLVASYSCVKNNQCEQNFDTFKQNIGSSVQTFLERWPQDSWRRIHAAITLLKTRWKVILGSKTISDKDKEAYQQKEEDILSSLGTITPLVKRSGRDLLAWAIATEKIKKSQQKIKQLITKEVEDLKRNSQAIVDVANDIAKLRISLPKATYLLATSLITKKPYLSLQENWWIINNHTQQRLSPHQVLISTILEESIHLHLEQKQQQYLVATSEAQTSLSQITFRLRAVKDMLENDIYDDLRRVCSMQCSNLWWYCG